MVVWTVPAKQDLKRIFDYIERDSRYYAEEVVSKVVDLSIGLDSLPDQGRIVPEINEPYIREVFVYSYRLIYQTKLDQVYVLAVIHMGRHLNDKMISPV